MVGAPRTTPIDPKRARCRPGGVDCGIVHRRVHGVPVRGPFPDIAVHIEKAPGVHRILPHLLGLPNSTETIISMGRIHIITPGINRGRTGTAGIFPLGFRG